MYLTISAEKVLIFGTELVHHLHNMCNTCMMKPEPPFFAPRISLIQRCALFQAGHHAQHPPCTSFAGHSGVQIANGYINGLNRYLVLYETAINVQNNGQWNGPLPNPETQI
jgi:hypothetical protein